MRSRRRDRYNAAGSPAHLNGHPMNYQGIDEINRQLADLHRRRKSLRMATGAAGMVAVVCGALLLITAVAGYWPEQPPVALRWVCLASVVVAAATATVHFLVRPALWRQTPAQTARFVEQTHPELRNGLINAVLLSDDVAQPSPSLVQQAINESTQRARRLDWASSVSAKPLKRWALIAAVACVAAAALGVAQGQALRRGLLAVIRPARYVPHTNTLVAKSITPGDVTVFAGQPIDIVATIGNESATPHTATLIIDGGEPTAMLPSDANTTYTHSLGPARQTVRYAVQIDDSRWPTDRRWYTISVIERVDLESLAVRYAYPAYTNLSPETPEAFTGPVVAPVGTQVTLTMTTSVAVPNATVALASGERIAMDRGNDARTFVASTTVTQDDAYTIVVADDADQTLRQFPQPTNGGPDTWDIDAVNDQPPTIRFVMPAQDTALALGGRLATRIRVDDDYGLTRVTLYGGKQGRPAQPIHEYPLPDGPGGAIDYTHQLDRSFDDGDVLVYYAEVTDNRDLPGQPGPQVARTAEYTVTVRNADSLAAERTDRYGRLRDRLLALLKLQAAQRVKAELAATQHDTVDAVQAAAAEIARAQRAIRTDMLDLAVNFPFDQQTQAIQQVLAELAGNEAQTAIAQADALGALTDLAERADLAGPLIRTQDAILRKLRMLAALVASLKVDDSAATHAAGEDLPNHAREQLEQLQAALEQYKAAQTKLVDQAADLAKKNVDDFTDADKAKLDQLIAAQDELDTFLAEAFSDLSELAQQDFASPTMLEELLSIKMDVTMVVDALSASAVEMAVALEQAGIENADTLTGNLERWLRDVPDREKWAMEDPTDDVLVEQSELPTELQDLVGDLLEEEEDLFEEMEDLTSQWADSLDLGAGWDAADGPISNMSAQGVTGNQLPNSSEISGRSGEGRAGKASGEHVQADAVGKGGRRTPTRLTGDAFQEGQVDDSATDPPGGATGGGKLSGAGGEGLEGPVPPPLAKEMARLAGQQAALINRAERLAAQLAPGDLAGLRLLESITLMNQVHDDLGHYRYRNVLRRKHVTMGSLQGASAALAGEADIVDDPSAALPKHVAEDIHDAGDGAYPDAYRRELAEYYRRLARLANGG